MFSENTAVWLVEGISRSLNSDQWYASFLFFSEHCKIAIRHETLPVRIRNSHCRIKKKIYFQIKPRPIQAKYALKKDYVFVV